MPMRPRPVPVSAKDRLDYEPETGRLIWKICGRPSHQGREAGFINSSGYRAIKLGSVRHMAHRIAWYIYTGQQPIFIDHINGNRSDNRIMNLRSVTHAENMRNRGRTKRRKHDLPEGVHRSKKRYMAQIMVNYEPIYLGHYTTPEDAHEAYLAARKEHFGAYHRSEL